MKEVIKFIVNCVGFVVIFIAVDFKREVRFNFGDWERWVMIGLVVLGVLVVHYNEMYHEKHNP